MNTLIHILNASKRLSPYKDLLRQASLSTIRKVQQRIKIANLDILIRESDCPENLKDIDGVGGYCPSGYFIQISIDINHPAFRKSLKQTLEKALIHELHHVARNQAGIKISDSTFLECAFSEGLADYFVFEITRSLPKWTTASLSQKNKKRLKKLFQREFAQKTTDEKYNSWFTAGSLKHRIPKYTGYVLIFELVKNYLKENPQQSAASLVSIPAQNIIKPQYTRSKRRQHRKSKRRTKEKVVFF